MTYIASYSPIPMICNCIKKKSFECLVKGFFCKVKIKFTFILEERLCLFDSPRTVQSHEVKMSKNNIDSLRSKVEGSWAKWSGEGSGCRLALARSALARSVSCKSWACKCWACKSAARPYWRSAPRGQSETSQLELSLKSNAFQKFTDLIDTHSPAHTHSNEIQFLFFIF